MIDADPVWATLAAFIALALIAGFALACVAVVLL